MKKQWTKEEEHELMNLFAQGKRTASVAKSLGRTASSVNLKRRKMAINLINDGNSKQDVISHTGISEFLYLQYKEECEKSGKIHMSFLDRELKSPIHKGEKKNKERYSSSPPNIWSSSGSIPNPLRFSGNIPAYKRSSSDESFDAIFVSNKSIAKNAIIAEAKTANIANIGEAKRANAKDAKTANIAKNAEIKKILIQLQDINKKMGEVIDTLISMQYD